MFQAALNVFKPLGRVNSQLLQRIFRQKMVDARQKCEPMLS